jgi:hypothetical protein
MKCNLPLNFQAVNFSFFGEISAFCQKQFKNSPTLYGRENFLEFFPKKSPHFEEKSFENVKMFGGFGQISSFLFSEVAIFSS